MSVEKVSFDDINNLKQDLMNEKEEKQLLAFFESDERSFPEGNDSKFVGGPVEIDDKLYTKLKKMGAMKEPKNK